MPPARLRFLAMAAIPESARLIHVGAHRAGPQAEKDDRFPRRHRPARAGSRGASGARRRRQARADRPRAGQRARGREFVDPANRRWSRSTPRSITNAAAPRASLTWKPPTIAQKAALLRLPDGGRGRRRWQRRRRGQQHRRNGARRTAFGGTCIRARGWYRASSSWRCRISRRDTTA